MNIQNLKIESYKVQMDVYLEDIYGLKEIVTQEYVMHGIAKFQIKAMATKIRQTDYLYVWVFAKFVKIANNMSISIKISSRALQIKDICIFADSKWHLIPNNYITKVKFDLYFTVEMKGSSKLKVLQDDDELTDLELRGDDGSIRVHKFMLAAISPVFKTMIQSDYKEIKNGTMHLEGTTKATLQVFKQYIYLNTLPPTDSKQILIIAMRYEVVDMETLCIAVLIKNLKAENVRELLEFAITHKSDKLMIEILRCVQNGFIRVNEIEQVILNAKDSETQEIKHEKEKS